MTYLRDRLTIARDLLHDSGSIFVQIGDENVHRVRALLDEVFGEENYVNTIFFQKTGHETSDLIPSLFDQILVFVNKRACLNSGKSTLTKLHKANFPLGTLGSGAGASI